MRVLLPLIFAPLLLLTALPAQAQQNVPEVVYYGFDPDIVTNYVTENRRTLGYLRVSVELMLPSRDMLKTIEYHEPLILDTIIGILSKQSEEKVKSLHGREEIRLIILEQLQQVLRRETGQPMVQDVLFTKYLYQ
ncbi:MULTISPECIES: flagellar basal body-associated FliL family protein [Alishewanella]|uniref:Flagellar protein FliL n=1 Tax=Alishewanella aestuarii B11 TaxID=1197174 RepID=J1Q577_9ALTE|nr:MULTISPECIES: flagellar basal body-associated FliL family protein [Alishewanella]EJI86298.1 flagellar basal body-associated protein FliL-like protein [Alishewanella aestuarii B11]OCW96910.1 flagellar basal body-associated protein FliL [Alishewanella sp. HH-ZS]